MTRRYEEWGGNPKGTPEDPKRCVEQVTPRGRWISAQCSKPRGYGEAGDLCKLHAKKIRRKELPL